MKPEPELIVPKLIVDRYGLGELGLLEYVCPQVSNKMLRAIAKCDYGNDESEHYSALKAILDGENWDKPLTWVPNEVLSLYRWSTFASQKELKSETDYHVTRSFACCVMRRIGDQHENYLPTSVETLEPLIYSAMFFKGEFAAKLKLEIIATLNESKPWDKHTMFWIFGLLVVSAFGEEKPMQDELQVVGDWLYRVNEESLPWFSAYTGKNPKTFLDINFETIHPNHWSQLAKRVVGAGLLQGDALTYIQSVSEHKPMRNNRATAHLLGQGWKAIMLLDVIRTSLQMRKEVKRQAKKQREE